MIGRIRGLLASVFEGGTGCNTLAAHGLLIGNGGNAINVSGAGSTGQVLTSNGASSDPTFQANIGAWAGQAQVSGSDFTTTSSSLVDITGLSFAGAASTTYEFQAWLDCATGASASGIKVGVHSTGTSPTSMWAAIGQSASSNGTVSGNNTDNAGGTTVFMTSSSTNGFIFITGIIKSGTGSPTISIRILAAGSQTVTVRVGSKFLWRVQ